MDNKKKKYYSFIIKTKKIFKEKMSEEEKPIFSIEEQPKISSGTEEPKEEDYQWASQNNKESEILKQLYIQSDFKKWNEIIKALNISEYDIKYAYQMTTNEILEKDIFANEKFIKEGSEDIFEILLKENKIDIGKIEDKDLKHTIKKISPDFVVINLSKNKFIEIFSKKFMYRFDPSFINLNDNIQSINLIGEIKNTPNSINIEQKKRYLSFCNYMNKKSQNQYYLILYIFNNSYKQFFLKQFFKKNPIIIGFIPKLYLGKYFDVCQKLKEELEEDIGKTIIKNNNNNLIEGKKDILNNDFNKNNKKEEEKEPKKEKNIEKIEPNEKIETNEINFMDMNIEELRNYKRQKEDFIIQLKKDLIEYEHLFIKKKRKLEDEEIILKKVTEFYNGKISKDKEK